MDDYASDREVGTVLLVGGEAVAEAVADVLRREGFRVLRADSPETVRDALAGAESDVLLVDATTAPEEGTGRSSTGSLDGLRDIPMVARALQRSEALHRGLVSMLLHDLRTPLSSLTLNLELVEMAPGLSPEERDDVAQARASARAMGNLMGTVQAIGRLEAGEVALELRAEDLAALASQAVERLRPPLSRHPIALDAEDVRVRCDAEATRRLIEELLAGAVGVSPPDHPVRVRVRRLGGVGRVEVTDEGRRIPPELRDLLLTRAGSVEVRRARRSHSRGFGPVYCRLIAEAQGGRCGIRVDDDAPGDRGNTFWVELPAA